MTKLPTLFILAGLPGTGKTTLSRHIAQSLNAVYLRIDTIEQALRDLCRFPVEGEGYRLTYRIAAENLQMGINVVADSCNPIELTRREWERVAIDSGASFVNVEVICSDVDEHRQRIESRVAEIPGMKMPTWSDVRNREYHDWSTNRIVVDTAGQAELDSVSFLMSELKKSNSDDGYVSN